MKVLDLFSGIGGFSLGLERAGMQTVAFCEIEPFCRKVLKKHWPDVPIYEDVRELNAERLRNDGIKRIDVVCGGFPCQPFSIAGRRKGAADDRDLWPEMCRIIEETKPAWVIGENVANFTDMAFTRTKADLESRGYQVQPFIIPACAVGAPHRRDRVWIVAHLAGVGGPLLDHSVASDVLQSRKPKKNKPHGKISARVDSKGVGNNSGAGYDGAWKEIMACENPLEGIAAGGKRKVKPAIRRGVHGVSRGLDEDIRRKRINTLGNTLVPQIAQIIGQSMLDLQAH